MVKVSRRVESEQGGGSMSETERPSTRVAAHIKTGQSRSRTLFVLGGVLVLSIGGFFAYEVSHALYVRSVTGSVFDTYVINHHIGHADISDDSSGFQADFCVLHLNKPVLQSNLASETYALMEKYHQLDGGTSMTLVYSDSATGKQITEASVEFLPAQKSVTMTLHRGSTLQTLTKKVDWSTSS